jgi:DNA-binding transcriptional MerR regulator
MLTIGQLAQASGVPTSTIRFWERKGLLSPTERHAGQRRYHEDVRVRVAVLRLCQDAGFTLDEIHRMLAEEETNPVAWRDFVRAKLVRIEERLDQLNRAHRMLSHALECPEDDIAQWPRFQQAVDDRLAARAAG